MGTRSLTSPKFVLTMSGTLVNAMTDGSSGSAPHPSLNYSNVLTSGSGRNQADRSWQSKTRTLYNGQAETIDLYDFAGVDIGVGAGLDGVGQALALEKLVAIAIINDNAVTAPGLLHIEASSSNGFTALGEHTSANGGALAGQGCLFKANPSLQGFDITDASNHQLKMTAVNGPVSYSIYLLARSDDEESSSSSLSVSSSSSISTSSSSQSMSVSSQSTSSSSSSSSISTSSSSSSSSLSSTT